MFTFGMQIEFATHYPIGSHQTTFAILAADSESEAHIIAAQMTACRPDCVMPVATKILTLEM